MAGNLHLDWPISDAPRPADTAWQRRVALFVIAMLALARSELLSVV